MMNSRRRIRVLPRWIGGAYRGTGFKGTGLLSRCGRGPRCPVSRDGQGRSVTPATAGAPHDEGSAASKSLDIGARAAPFAIPFPCNPRRDSIIQIRRGEIEWLQSSGYNAGLPGRLLDGVWNASPAPPKCHRTRWRGSKVGMRWVQSSSKRSRTPSKGPASSSLTQTTADQARDCRSSHSRLHAIAQGLKRSNAVDCIQRSTTALASARGASSAALRLAPALMSSPRVRIPMAVTISHWRPASIHGQAFLRMA